LKAASLYLTCSSCALQVVVEFEIATGDAGGPEAMPQWACPSCRATHDIGVLGRVRAVVSPHAPIDLPRDDE
jgi:hypothetical protein